MLGSSTNGTKVYTLQWPKDAQESKMRGELFLAANS